jgi:hypothetical protein
MLRAPSAVDAARPLCRPRPSLFLLSRAPAPCRPPHAASPIEGGYKLCAEQHWDNHSRRRRRGTTILRRPRRGNTEGNTEGGQPFSVPPADRAPSGVKPSHAAGVFGMRARPSRVGVSGQSAARPGRRAAAESGCPLLEESGCPLLDACAAKWRMVLSDTLCRSTFSVRISARWKERTSAAI